uniref:Uncharacterized protein n=1 Tax=Peronospora matthiolae TaxID=2874970 RepID=A0AAV1UMJ4_9STRA
MYQCFILKVAWVAWTPFKKFYGDWQEAGRMAQSPWDVE